MNTVENISTYESHEIERQAETCPSLAEHLKAAPDTAQDIFAALYKTLPQLADADTLPGTVDRVRRDILAAGIGTREWAGLRDYTARNAFLAARATPAMADEVLDNLSSNGEYQDTQRQLEEYEQFLRGLEDADPDEPYPVPASWGEYRQDLQDQLQHERRQVMRRVAAEAEEGCEQMAEAMAAWGLDDGPNTGMEPGALRELTERVMASPKLQEIARLAGRMERVALTTHEARSTECRQTICDVVPGNDLSHLLPTELVGLTHPDLRPLFMRRYSDKQLLCYKLEGKEPLGRGPIILLYDESGSMAGAKEVWAKALVFGLLTIAAKERRDVVVFAFASWNQVARWDFPGGQKDSKALVELAEHFFSGGTDPTQALRDALASVAADTQDRGDIIFLSDGAFHVEPSVLDGIQRAKTERGLRLTTVGIGACRVQALELVADDQITLRDIAHDQEVTDAVFSL